MNEITINHCEAIDIAQMSQEEFAHSRTSRLGATDVVAIIGLSPWKQPIDVWLDKTRPKPQPMNEAMYWGTILEPIVAEEYAKRHPALSIINSKSTYVLKENPVLSTTPDRFIVDEHNISILEIKTSRKVGRFNDELPPDVLAQVIWNCGITGCPQGHVVALSNGSDYVESMPIHINDWQDQFNNMRTLAEKFWRDHVLADEPPTVTNFHGDMHKRIFGDLTPNVKIIEDSLNAITQIISAKEELKFLEEKIKMHEAELFETLGNSKEGACGKYRIKIIEATRRTVEHAVEIAERYPELKNNIKESSYRFLKITEQKGSK